MRPRTIRRPSPRRTPSHRAAAAAVCDALERRVLLSLSPSGPEFRVNTYTSLAQADAVVASDSDGDFVVAWRSRDQDGSLYGIYAQRYNSAGVAQGSEFRANTYTTSNQTTPTIAMDSDGDFVIAWESAGQDSGTYGIYAQRYNSAGLAQGGEFRVNADTVFDQIDPSVAMSANGDFIVAWRDRDQAASPGVYAQRFNATGVPQGAQFRVNTFTTGTQESPAVAMDNNGNFVVAWHSGFQDGSAYGIYAQRYSAAGVMQAGEFRVNTYTTLGQGAPSAAMDADGDFVITWQSDGQDGANFGVYAQRYNSSGIPQGDEFRVNSFTTSNQQESSIAMDDAGNFAITWTSGNEDPGYGVYAQRYAASGAVLGSEFRVNTFTTGSQAGPAMAMDAAGNFVVAWQSDGQDGSGHGIYAQRYSNVAPLSSAPLGGEFLVNTTTTGFQGRSHIAADDAGNFVVTWASPSQGGDTVAVYAQRYDADGTPLGTEFNVNTTVASTTTWTVRPRVAMDEDGDFVIAWSVTDSNSYLSTFEVRARRYNAAGEPQGGEIVVSPAFEMAGQASVAMDPDGDFVVTWFGNMFPSQNSILARRYNAAGVPQGSILNVGISPNLNNLPRVAISDAGAFAVVWRSDPSTITARTYSATGVALGAAFTVATDGAKDGSAGEVSADAEGNFVVAYSTTSSEVFARQYYASGAARGPAFQVNQYTTNFQNLPRISSNAQGEFLVSWNSIGQDGDLSGVYARRFDRYGVAMGDEFRVNSYTTSDQLTSQGVLHDDGDFVIQWSSNLQDGSLFGVYAQRFGPPDVTPPLVNSSSLEVLTRQAISVTFNEPLNPATISATDLAALNLDDNSTPVANSVILSAGNTVATWIFNTPGTFISDGDYSFTLPAGAVTDVAGNALAAPYNLSGANIYFLAGDANRDRRVNVNDFTILAGNFGQSNRNFSQGDFNYDNLVNVNDFTILASRFGTVLGPDGSIQQTRERLGAIAPPFGGSRIREEETTESLIDILS